MNTPPSPVIEVDHVNLGQGAQPVLEDISLTINEHEFHAIIGPNGGGKTTLLKVILGLIRPDSGTVRVMGGTPHEMRAHLGYVPSSGHLTFSFRYRCRTWSHPVASVTSRVRSGASPVKTRTRRQRPWRRCRLPT